MSLNLDLAFECQDSGKLISELKRLTGVPEEASEPTKVEEQAVKEEAKEEGG